MPSTADDVDPRRVRLGLALVTIAFLVSVVMGVVVDEPLGRAIMTAIAVSAVLRAVLLVRSLRRDRAGA